ncbi:MAG: Holliday junction resolvase [Thermoplasmata archaeon]|nr:Holliday junction resolvase [Thermoplasmata archaeon]
MAGSSYERELKAILSGDTVVIKRVTRTSPPEEREGYMAIVGRPFIVIRAAGSFGVDLVAVRDDFSFPIEVKASVNPVLHFSDKPRLSEQAEALAEECSRAGVVPLYAFRLKGVRGGDSWRVFTLDIGEVRGKARFIYRRLPRLPRTKGGNLVMRWKEGMPLHKFLSYVGE